MGSSCCRRLRGTRLAETTGVVLAGGRSIRFGRDKLAEPYRGIPILHHAVLRVAEVCDEVVVVLASGAPEPRLPADVSVRVARDASEGEGPLAGALAGLLEVRTELALVAGGDMPDLQPPVLRELLRAASEGSAGATAPAEGDGYRPLPCVVGVEPARELARVLLDGGRRRLRDLLDAMGVAPIDEAAWRALDPEGRTLFDVDVEADLDG